MADENIAIEGSHAPQSRPRLVLFCKILIIFVLTFPWILAVALGVAAGNSGSALGGLQDKVRQLQEALDANSRVEPPVSEPVSEPTPDPNATYPSSNATISPETTTGAYTPGAYDPNTAQNGSGSTYGVGGTGSGGTGSTSGPNIIVPITPGGTTSGSGSGSSGSGSSGSGSSTTKKTYKNTVYLTFTGGPSANTVKILDALKAANVKASFFVSATDYDARDATMKRIVAEGHLLALSSYSTKSSVVYKDLTACKDDFGKIRTLVSDVTSTTPNYYRFLGGSTTGSASKSLLSGMKTWLGTQGVRYFDWNVSGGEKSSSPVAASTIAACVRDGASATSGVKMVELHDGAAYTTTPAAVKTLLKTLKADGHNLKKITSGTKAIHR